MRESYSSYVNVSYLQMWNFLTLQNEEPKGLRKMNLLFDYNFRLEIRSERKPKKAARGVVSIRSSHNVRFTKSLNVIISLSESAFLILCCTDERWLRQFTSIRRNNFSSYFAFLSLLGSKLDSNVRRHFI